MTVVTFEQYVPSPRFDGVPWTKAYIEEAVAEIGPYTVIELKNLSPVDTDPSKPQPRNFTTANATLVSGWYRITFSDAVDNKGQPTVPQFNGPKLAYEPTVDQVARKVLSRTRDKYGNALGTFNSDTAPTDAQVQAIVDDVITEIADVVGDVVPDALVDDASNVVAIRAAMQIELDFYSDQVNTGRSIYPQLAQQYKDALAALSAAVIAVQDGAVVATAPAMSPSYDFPEPGIGFKTVW